MTTCVCVCAKNLENAFTKGIANNFLSKPPTQKNTLELFYMRHHTIFINGLPTLKIETAPVCTLVLQWWWWREKLLFRTLDKSIFSTFHTIFAVPFSSLWCLSPFCHFPFLIAQQERGMRVFKSSSSASQWDKAINACHIKISMRKILWRDLVKSSNNNMRNMHTPALYAFGHGVLLFIFLLHRNYHQQASKEAGSTNKKLKWIIICISGKWQNVAVAPPHKKTSAGISTWTEREKYNLWVLK